MKDGKREGVFTIKDPEYSYIIKFKDNERIEASAIIIKNFEKYTYNKINRLI
jgi:hypothetical protein